MHRIALGAVQNSRVEPVETRRQAMHSQAIYFDALTCACPVPSGLGRGGISSVPPAPTSAAGRGMAWAGTDSVLLETTQPLPSAGWGVNNVPFPKSLCQGPTFSLCLWWLASLCNQAQAKAASHQGYVVWRSSQL